MPTLDLSHFMWVVAFFGIQAVGLIIYRLFVTPLAKIPGPKLAAATSLYAVFYDVMYKGDGGRYIWVVEDMHKRYGPIVRIKPGVIHINDPEFIDQVYTGAGKRRDKTQMIANGLSMKHTALTTIDHYEHRRRRAILNPFFSKQSIRQLERLIHQAEEKVLHRLDMHAESGLPIKMNTLYNAVTQDIISDYCFGESTNSLDRDDLNEPFFKGIEDSAKSFHFDTYNPWFYDILRMLPLALVTYLVPFAKVYLELAQTIQRQIEAVQRSVDTPQEKDQARKTIFHDLLTAEVPDSDRAMERLVDEAQILLMAGTFTTANTLVAITFYLLKNPDVLKKLKAELGSALPGTEESFTLSQIETLPYLSAVIKEGLRILPGVSFRQERVAPDEDLIYRTADGKAYTIPKGTTVTMTATLLSRLEEIYPSPSEFRPERFLENPRLDRYQLTFSRGTRICLGMNLALEELYVLVASIFRKYDLYDGSGKQKCPTLELYDTNAEDIEIERDLLTPTAKVGSGGLRLRVR